MREKEVYKNILITGASNPLGEQLIQRLLDDSRVGHIIAVADKGQPLTFPESDRLTAMDIDIRKQRKVHDHRARLDREEAVALLAPLANTASR